MRILVIAGNYPTPDRSAGELRFSKIVAGLARVAQTDFCALRAEAYANRAGAEIAEAYRQQLCASGVNDVGAELSGILRRQDYDAVFVEYYHNATQAICDLVRFHSPRARIVIDSVDVHFSRLQAMARLTGASADARLAQQVRGEEMAAYRRGDLVVALSEQDKAVLLEEDGALAVEILPTFHSLHPPSAGHGRIPNSLVFVGGFRHTPNVDAVLHFAREVMPLVQREFPDVRLTVVGGEPPPEIRDLECEAIHVTGFVQDTTPYLHSHAVSIAPVRFGAGLKGKIGEAMAHGLPVVTTSVGAEGFGFSPGEHVLIGDGPAEFAAHVIALLRDGSLRSRIGAAGYEFVSRMYSDVSVATRVDALLARVRQVQPHRLPIERRLRLQGREFYERHLRWRFGPSAGSRAGAECAHELKSEEHRRHV